MSADADGLPLDEYVAQTLLAIVAGVIKAQGHEVCGEYVGRSPGTGATELSLAKDRDDNVVTTVRFDLATTIQDKSGKGGGLAIKVLPLLTGELGANTELTASSVSRIAFNVPVSVPKPEAQRVGEDAKRRARAQNAQREIDSYLPNGWTGV